MDDASRLTENYVDLGNLGVGGMGEVRRVRDRRLNRVVAMKILRRDAATDPVALARFVEEAQATAQLQHPGIVPVHEYGYLPDGRPYFTMKEVRGRTLAEVIAEVHAVADPLRSATPAGWTFRRLIDAFRAVCDAVACAHASGVVHRDLKPQNVMVGAFGEVLVLDWGIALILGTAAEGVQTDRSRAAARHTLAGAVSGTPTYMAPEQARAAVEAVGIPSDVYALGAVLYQILSGRPPYVEADAQTVLRRLLEGPPIPVVQAARLQQRTGRRYQPAATLELGVGTGSGVMPVREAATAGDTPGLWEPPAELVEACERAMARDPAQRYADAGALAQAMTTWADGARRRDQAHAEIARAEAQLPELRDLARAVHDTREAARLGLAALPPWASEAEKHPCFDLEDRARRLADDLETREREFEGVLHAAISQDPDLPDAHGVLARHYRFRHEWAERLNDPDARHYERLLRAHDRGENAIWLRGEGRLSLMTDPPGAAVRLLGYRMQGRRRLIEPVGDLGLAPLIDCPLPMGSWLLDVTHPDRLPMRYPVRIGRLGHWHGRAPGRDAASPIPLLPPGMLGDREVYVPAGWMQRGGDPQASGGGEAETVWVPGFIVQRFPVTNAEFLAFLNARIDAGDRVTAEACAPREQTGGPCVWPQVDGRYRLPEDWLPDAPVVDIDWAGAKAYAHWAGGRLLSEDEWEKAARGVDGRAYPWGDAYDPTFSRTRDSVAGKARPAPVDCHPVDCSPYGVRGMAGNACTWCAGGTEERRPYRGGAWAFHPVSARAACRYAADPRYRYFGLGVRWARDLPGDSD